MHCGSRARGLLLQALVGLLGVMFCAPAAAEDLPRTDYDAAIASALEHYRARDWAAARAGFEAAHAIDPGARTLRGIGLCAYYAQDYVAAAVAMEQALGDSRNVLTGEQREQMVDLLNRTYARVSRLRVHATPAGASVSVDEQPIPNDRQVPIAPGRHRLEVSLEGHTTQAQEFEAAAGEQVSLPIELVDEASLSVQQAAAEDPLRSTAGPPVDYVQVDTDRVPMWIAGGATVAFALAALGFAIAGNAELDDLEQQCSREGCSEDTRDALWEDSSIETFETLTNVALVATAAGAATTLTLFLTAGDTGNGGGARTGRSPTAVGVRVAGRF